MKILGFTLMFFFISVEIFAIDFEGNISFVQKTLYDTTYFDFSVKNALVRVDEHNTRQEISQSIIVDIHLKTITALSPALKLYTTIQTDNVKSVQPVDFVVTKSQRFKYINGLKCYFWKVRNKNMNSDIAYWVFETDFSFFNEVLNILSKSPDYARYCYPFYQIQTSGFIPVESIERNLVREERSRLVLQRIHRCQLNRSIFKVPASYTYLQP